MTFRACIRKIKKEKEFPVKSSYRKVYSTNFLKELSC